MLDETDAVVSVAARNYTRFRDTQGRSEAWDRMQATMGGYITANYDQETVADIWRRVRLTTDDWEARHG